jgi:hypothetical protein
MEDFDDCLTRLVDAAHSELPADQIIAALQRRIDVVESRSEQRDQTDLDTADPPYEAETAEAEGWFISYAPGNSDKTVWRLERRDENPVFGSDQEAHAHVVARAAAGSPYHQSCLNFLRFHEPTEYRIVMESAQPKTL